MRRISLSIAGNLISGLLVALIYFGLSVVTGTEAGPAILGGLVLGALTFIVAFIVTRGIAGQNP